MILDEKLSNGDVIVLDGAIGSEIDRLGGKMHPVAWCGVANVTDPDIVRQVHEAYLAAGRARRRARRRFLVRLLQRTASAFGPGRPHARRRLPGRRGRGRVSGPRSVCAGNATSLAVSTRFAGPPLRCGPSGDTASAAAKRLTTTGRVLPVVIDRLLTPNTAGASTMPLTSSASVGRFRSSRAPNQSEYTLIPPSDCPTNQDHLNIPPHERDRPRNAVRLPRPSFTHWPLEGGPLDDPRRKAL